MLSILSSLCLAQSPIKEVEMLVLKQGNTVQEADFKPGQEISKITLEENMTLSVKVSTTLSAAPKTRHITLENGMFSIAGRFAAKQNTLTFNFDRKKLSTLHKHAGVYKLNILLAGDQIETPYSLNIADIGHSYQVL